MIKSSIQGEKPINRTLKIFLYHLLLKRGHEKVGNQNAERGNDFLIFDLFFIGVSFPISQFLFHHTSAFRDPISDFYFSVLKGFKKIHPLLFPFSKTVLYWLKL